MKPILFREDETAFTSNGLGRIDALKCEVTEERNGQFELEMDVSIDDRHFQDIREGRILLARHDDTVDKQPFEIYQISKPLNGRVTVYAHHISYRTEKITVTPFATQNDITAAMNAIQTNCVGSNPFVLWTDKSTAGKFSMTKPATLRSLLGGSAGSLLDVYGTGEYEWDKFTIKLRSRRGRDTGVVLRYGKNITDLKKVSDTSSVWTGVVPFWAGVSEDDPDNEELVMLPEVVLYSSAAANYAYAMIVPLDLSGNFEEKPTETQLRNAAQNYVDNNEITAIPASIDVSFVAAWQTDEYKNVAALERLSLCDTLTVRYTKLGVDNQAKIIKTVFDVLKEKYISMTIGDVRPNLATEISGGLQASVDEIRRSMATRQRVSSVVNAAVENATAKITGGDGGYIVIKRDANGNPREILAMNTDDVATASNVLRINMNGIGFSSTGIDGPYRSAWTLDGQFVADFITTGTLNAARVNGGTLTGVAIDIGNGNFTVNSNGDVTITSGSIDIGEGSFVVNQYGQLEAFDATIAGTITSGGQSNEYIKLDSAVITGGIGNTEYGRIDFRGVTGYSTGPYLEGNAIYLMSSMLLVGSNYTMYEGFTGTMQYISDIQRRSDGGINWWRKSIQFVNGVMVTNIS